MRDSSLTRIGRWAVTVCLLWHLLAGERAHAQPALWSSATGGNDHFYEFVQVQDPFAGTNNSWATAKANAEARAFNNMPGHLATITSTAENIFVFGLITSNFTQFEGAWLGGKAPDGWLVGPEAGQSFAFTNWGTLESNNSGYMYMNIGTPFAGIAPGQWADTSIPGGLPSSVSDPVIGYFVEYSAVVPEPSSCILAGMALIAFRALKGKKSRRQTTEPNCY